MCIRDRPYTKLLLMEMALVPYIHSSSAKDMACGNRELSSSFYNQPQLVNTIPSTAVMPDMPEPLLGWSCNQVVTLVPELSTRWFLHLFLASVLCYGNCATKIVSWVSNLLLSNRVATSTVTARTFRGTNDLFTATVDWKVTLGVLGPQQRT